MGADMVVGSSSKTPAAACPIGGYICGTKACVSRCAYRLSASAWARRWGPIWGHPPAVPGFFLAPTVVAGAEKGAIFAANLYEPFGYRCIPGAGESRHDIIQAVELGSEEAMVAFCRGIQAAAPVDSFATPMPWDMPGYESQVIMAPAPLSRVPPLSSSADGPIRPPYAVDPGGSPDHAKLGILMSLQKALRRGSFQFLASPHR